MLVFLILLLLVSIGLFISGINQKEKGKRTVAGNGNMVVAGIIFIVCVAGGVYYFINMQQQQLAALQLQKQQQITALQQKREQCVNQAKNNELSRWTGDCKSRGLKNDCQLPQNVATYYDSQEQKDANFCLQLYK